jgi:hypothetical protein
MAMNDEQERERKEVAVACLNIIFQKLSGETEISEKNLARIICVRVKVRTGNFLN